MKTFILTALLITFMISAAESITITVGGNVEDIATKTDQITMDVCSYVYDCSNVRQVSLKGKNNEITQGWVSWSNLKATYANTTFSADKADTTEKASWADTAASDKTAMTSVFSAMEVVDQMSDNAYHSALALKAETAPAADQSIVTLLNTGTVSYLKKIDYYSKSDSAGTATVTNNVNVYNGSDLFPKSTTGINWYNGDCPDLY